MIELATEPDDLCLRVKDNGVGFEVEAPNQTGMGLRVMEYRACSIGGELKISSQLNQGTEIRCRLPLAVCAPAASDVGPPS